MTGRSETSPIEDYLDGLTVALRRESPRRARHLVSEAEAHLYDVAAELVASGSAPPDAEAQAVARFGSVYDVARAEARAVPSSRGAAVAKVGMSGLLLGSIGAIAVGASGLIAAAIRLIGGIGTIVDLNSGPSLSVTNCTRWLALDPSAPTCQAAALNDWALETIVYRVAFGILGLIALGVYFLMRPVARTHGIGPLPRTISDTIAATLFGVAGLWTLGMGIDAGVLHQGWGQWISAAAVSLPVGVFFGLRLLRRVHMSDETLIFQT